MYNSLIYHYVELVMETFSMTGTSAISQVVITESSKSTSSAYVIILSNDNTRKRKFADVLHLDIPISKHSISTSSYETFNH